MNEPRHTDFVKRGADVSDLCCTLSSSDHQLIRHGGRHVQEAGEGTRLLCDRRGGGERQWSKSLFPRDSWHHSYFAIARTDSEYEAWEKEENCESLASHASSWLFNWNSVIPNPYLSSFQHTLTYWMETLHTQRGVEWESDRLSHVKWWMIHGRVTDSFWNRSDYYHVDLTRQCRCRFSVS